MARPALFDNYAPERSIDMQKHLPLGPDGTWKTGQRVPFTGHWSDQYGDVVRFEVGTTFPPCIDRKGECAFRFLVAQAVPAA